MNNSVTPQTKNPTIGGAISTIMYLKEKGIKIPDDIAVVSRGNEPKAEVIEF